MASRLELQERLESLLGNKHVYYQPPESIKMEYPAIVYSKSDIRSIPANDGKYSLFCCYEIIVISKRPDHPVIKELLKLPYCTYSRTYTSDNLNHDALYLYY